MPTRSVQRWFYELYSYYAILNGVTSYRYDFVLRQYRSTKWTQLVASLANLCILFVILMDLYFAWFNGLKLDLATVLTIRLETTVNDVVCLLRVLERVPRDRATCEIGKRLFRLSCQQQQQQKQQQQHRSVGQDMRERQLNRIYLAKNCILWLLATFLVGFMLVVYRFVGLPLGNSLVNQLVLLIYVLAMHSQDVVMHAHFLLSWRICRMYVRLNRRIKHLVKANSVVDSLELHQLRSQHWQLARITQRLTEAYNFTIISFRLSLIVTAASLGYYFSVFRYQPLIYQIVSFVLYAALALDGYIIDLIYDWTVGCHRETSLLLRQQDVLKQPDRQLSRGCELLALQVASFPLQFKPFGMFVTGKATWLSNISSIFSWMFVLLQYRIVSRTKS